MKRLWVAAALAPLSFAAMSAPRQAHADTQVSTATTTPLATSAAGNITITSAGSIKPTAGPAAVTIDSSATVSNAGTISYANVSDAAGIVANVASGGFNATITNTGAISLTETTTGVTTNQSISTGPFANGANRTGIEVGGTGVFNGSVSNTGAITIIGENSAGIAINTELNGSLSQTGSITVVGGSYSSTPGGTNLDVSYGVHSTGKITGNVTLSGTISATGQNAVGAALDGDVGGGVTVGGTITTTGYRSTTAPTDPTVLAKLNADQTLQGGPALQIGGNVAGGILLNAAVAASGNVAAVPEGILTTYGSAPALLIGGGGAITVGADANGHSLEIGGAVSASGVYPNVAATGVQIGGTNPLAVPTSGVIPGNAFGAVNLADGILVSGTVAASSLTNTAGEGGATAILIGGNATVGNATTTGLTVSGTVEGVVSTTATGNSSSTNPYPVTASAIKVDAAGNLSSINNSGVIAAAITGVSARTTTIPAAGGTQGQAIAIDDESGTVTQVTNTKTISATITPIVSTGTVDPNHSNAVAIWLKNTTGNVTVQQNANGNTSITPTITGKVIFGATGATGSENLDLEAGKMTGDVLYNGVGNNSLTINGGATLTGAVTQVYDGNATINGSLAIDVNNGKLDITSPTSIHSSGLHIGGSGEIDFTVNPTDTTSTQVMVAGNATLDSGAKIGVAFTGKLGNVTGDQTYHLIEATAVTSGNISGALLSTLPYVYQGSLSTTATNVDLLVHVKSTQDLGFNPAQAAAFGAIYNQLNAADTQSAQVLNDFLAQTDRSGFLHIYNQFLPDYAGGPFEAMASAQRAIAQAQADAPVRLQSDTTRGWVQEIGFLANQQSNAKTNGYQATGFGLAGGIEHATGDSAVGATLAFISNGVDNSTQTKDASLSQVAVEAGLYWRAGGEGLNASASINGGYVSMGSHRLLLDQTAAGTVTLLRNAESNWTGAIGSAQFGVSYQMTMGRFFMRPELSADYIALYESSHSEHGGGTSMNLAMNSRLSTEASATADVVLGYTFGTAFRWRPELTVGYRQIVSGGPASTTARFVTGTSAFTLKPDLSDRGGLLARLGLRASSNYADITAAAGGEFRDGYQTYDARAVARFLF